MKRGRFFRKNKEFLLFLMAIFFIFPLFPTVSADVATNVTVPNSPPVLIEQIPDQSWPSDTDLINAFDLDDYFIDPNGDEINFSNSTVPDIDLVIDPITNIVSFYPDSGFVGERYVTFYAVDKTGNASSNQVKLSVGLDNVSPTWSSPAKSKGDVYQNDYINLSAIWEDNVQLDNYTLSVNQGGTGWVNYPSVNFSGVYNVSIYEIQISANAGKTIEWKIYAWDTSGNMNVTENQSFVVQEAIGEEAPPPEEEEVTGGFGKRISQAAADLDLTPSRKLKDFKLSLFDIKFSIKQGTSKTTVLKISNVGTEDLEFFLQDTGLLNFVIFSETEFELLPGNSKEITIDFRIPRSAYPGQYFGFINVNSIGVNKTVPVVLDIQQIDLDYDIVLNISEDYKTVRPGEEAVANIFVYNIKDLFQTNVTLHYSIKDYNGTIYNFSEEKINFSTSFVTNRSLQIPPETPEGKYIFYARASDDDNIAIDSDFFFVGKRFTFSAFLQSNLIFLFIFLLAVFLAIFMVKYQKDRRKERILHLYMMLTKLKNLIKQGKTKEALELFLRIRSQYKEPLSEDILQDKEKLKKEMLKLYEVINPEALKKIQEQEKQNAATKKVPAKPGEKSAVPIKQAPTPTKPGTPSEKPAATENPPQKTPLVKKIVPKVLTKKPATPPTKPVATSPVKPAILAKPATKPTTKPVAKALKKPIPKQNIVKRKVAVKPKPAQPVKKVIKKQIVPSKTITPVKKEVKK